MDNLHLFDLINSASGLSGVRLCVALGLADGLVYLLAPAGLAIWIRWGGDARRELLLLLLLAAAVSIGLVQLIAHAWPHPRPAALPPGTPYLAGQTSPGLPSHHVTVLWSLALSALCYRPLAVWGFPLLATGILVGWMRVFLGANLPYDVAAALPVALAGSALVRLCRGQLQPLLQRLLAHHDRGVDLLRSRWSCHRQG